MPVMPTETVHKALQESSRDLSQFQVLKTLGKGQYGKVFKVQRLDDGQAYAMKEVSIATSSEMDDKAQTDAVNEVRLLVSIRHPNVIRCYDAFVSGHHLYVVMEYARHGDLQYYISKGKTLNTPFPEEVVWRLLLQLCRGLKALHAKRIIHRDLKPANIFLGQQDLLKIGDMGMSKVLKQVDMAFTVTGTPYYMAPEVWLQHGYSFSSDLWSLGAVLYEMMTFHPPHEGRSVQELCIKIVQGSFVPIPVGRYSKDLIGFCHALLDTNPTSRPSLDQILNSEEARQWQHVVPEQPAPDAFATGLLDTIQIPKDLRLLQQNLPPPSYESP